MAIGTAKVGALATNSGTGPITPAHPAGLAVDDVKYLHVYSYNGGNLPTLSGWEKFPEVDNPDGFGSTALYRRVHQSGDSAPTISGGPGGGLYGVMVAWPGVDTTTPEDVTVASAQGDSATLTAPSATTVTAAAVVVHFYVLGDNGTLGSPTNSASLTYGDASYSTTVGGDACFAGAHKAIASPGASGATAVTATGAADQEWMAYTVALRPAATGEVRELAGSVDVASGASGTPARTRNLAGSAGTAAAATAEVARTRDVAGSGSAATGATATMSRDAALTGTGSSATDASGALIVGTPRSLDGAAPVATGADGALARSRGVTGAAAAASDGSGALSADRPLDGAAGTGSSAQGALVVAGSGSFAGSGPAAVGAQGTAIVDRPLAAAAAAGSGAAAELTVARPLAGAATAATDATPAPLPVARPLAATAAAAVAATGELPVDRPLAGAVTAAAVVEADLRVNSGGILNGAAATVSDAAAELVVARQLAGAAAAAGSAVASLSIDDLAADALAGAAATVTDAVGELRTLRPLGGDAHTTASAVATLSIPAGVPPPQDNLPPRGRGWRPAPPRTTYRPPTVIYTAV